ncbi:SpoIIIAH-like family protein [Neobacillus sp. OS1-32]|jgi:stage III sporulation protein AH|uniref:SpoIIIAH-like family protein n=1 Tax=Neobacillus paridis TaxID=2803862 RepID=A0ABS1TL10_9BACI|nr:MULTISPECIES: SpoIIIAH-like family protein [Neobacillus]MBL4951449.1 SpoIIIAH-like family protein [Neobacillus paridis]WML30750.1 SpoIIIAH-like family protein [Neobacillus sp. OS1-32]
MLLKKQTVWLLTMLSLVVVLSVYYLTSPEQQKSDLAAVEEKAKDKVEKNQATQKSKATEEKKVNSTIASDAEFDELRMDLQDERSQKEEELTMEMAATNLPADERSKIKDQMDELRETAHKEEILETMIKTMGYEDALVRADGENVKVTVKAKKKPSAQEANKIILEVKKEIDHANFVAVTYQPSK